MPIRDEPPNSSSSAGREALQSEVAREETNLRQLEAEQAKAKARLSGLRIELAARDHAPAPTRRPTTSLADGPRTPTDRSTFASNVSGILAVMRQKSHAEIRRA